jgi:hypothetical protein
MEQHQKETMNIRHHKDGKTFTWISTFAEYRWLVSVLQVILNVTHFVVDSPQVFSRHRGTHFDPLKHKIEYYLGSRRL